MLFRLIAVRRHKNIVFCDSFNEKYEKIQIAIPIEIFNKHNLKIGSVIFANFKIVKNKFDNDLYLIKWMNKFKVLGNEAKVIVRNKKVFNWKMFY